MTPEAARDKILGGQNADIEGHTCSGIPQSSKKRGSWTPEQKLQEF